MQGIFRNESRFIFFKFFYSFKASINQCGGRHDIAVKALGCLHLTSEYMNFSPGPAPGSSTLVLATCTGVPGSLLQPGAALTIVALGKQSSTWRISFCFPFCLLNTE